jgi:DNA mismatch repair protein MutS
LGELEQQSLHAGQIAVPSIMPQQVDLFAVNNEHPVLQELTTIQPDNLSPKEALEIIYHLKHLTN